VKKTGRRRINSTYFRVTKMPVEKDAAGGADKEAAEDKADT
jgi:hypothetical protein